MRIHLLIDTISINVEKDWKDTQHTAKTSNISGGESKFRERERGLSGFILYAFRREGKFQPIY